MNAKRFTMRFDDRDGDMWVSLEIETVDGKVIQLCNTEIDASVIHIHVSQPDRKEVN